MNLQNRVLSKGEIQKVIAYHGKSFRRKSLNTQRSYAIFRLSCCCGLRCGEIAGLELRDFFLQTDKPFIRIRKETTKGHRRRGTTELVRKARTVSLSIDRLTREDLAFWLAIRMEQSGGDRYAPFICSQTKGHLGMSFDRRRVDQCWRTALLCLGRDRAATTNCHMGRHTAISMLLHQGYSPVFVRDFAGHASIATTNLYAHAYESEHLTTEVFNFTAPTAD